MRASPGWVVGTLVAVIGLAGCGRMRFVVDTVPAVDEMTETVVLDDGGGRRAKVALIDVEGLIADAGNVSPISRSENPIDRMAESLRKAEADRSVKAVILRINSPGGTVTASDIMYRELMHFRERSGKPVVALMGGIATSGGYYLACGADEIIAHPSTITGSIGVIMQTFNMAEGMRRIGISADAITSGPNKAVGSPFAPMSAEHRELLQGVVDDFYGNFLAVVKERRPNLPESDIGWITDGRIVTGRRAAEIGVVDHVGDLRDAFALAKDRATVDRAQLVKYHRPIEHVGSMFAAAPAPPANASLLQLNVNADAQQFGANFWYVWDPTAWK